MNKMYLVGKYKKCSNMYQMGSTIVLDVDYMEFPVMLGSMADNVLDKLKDGAIVGVTGTLRKIEKYSEIELIADKITMLS